MVLFWLELDEGAAPEYFDMGSLVVVVVLVIKTGGLDLCCGFLINLLVLYLCILQDAH